MRVLQWAAVGLVTVFSTASYAETAQQALGKFVDDVRTVTAEFYQKQTDERGAVIAEGSGTMMLERPGRFRWEIAAPNSQLIVTDGTSLWLYEPDLKQVTIRAASSALEGTPAAMLSQKKALTDAFNVTDQGMEGSTHKLKLLPKSKDSDFVSVDLWLENHAPARLRFMDQLGGATDIRFKNIRTNVAVAPSQFKLVIPKGVEIVEDGAPAPKE